MEPWFCIAGLGNPGREYAGTRHNAGFLVVQALASRWAIDWKDEARFRALLAKGEVHKRRLFLCQPTTFMNSSGEALGKLVAYFRVAVERILVVMDDADLPLGEIRLRPRGSSGGHHGLESIEQYLGTRDYARLKVGIGRQAGGARQITGHVLGRFDARERAKVDAVIEQACRQAECWLTDGIDRAMNRFNGVIEESRG